VDLEQHAALLGLERTVEDTGGTAGIGRAQEGLAALALRIIADGEVADSKNLFPMIVMKGSVCRYRISAGAAVRLPLFLFSSMSLRESSA
jgi:hypothetical protein